jgi:iodotyrosine deiodinase
MSTILFNSKKVLTIKNQIIMAKQSFIPLINYKEYTIDEMLKRSQTFYNQIKTRRTDRDFSDRIVQIEIIEKCIKAAGTSPSGANFQPLHIVAISNPEIKKKSLQEIASCI